MPITILDTKVEGDEIWLKVALGRNTDILEKILFTDSEVTSLKRQAIKEYLHNYVEKMLDNDRS